jgi:hypothetical protein
MSRAFTPLLVLALSLPLGAACGGDDDGDDDGGSSVDAGGDGGDDGGDDDGGGPDAAAGCVPTDVLDVDWRPIASVSAGAVTATPGKDRTDAVIDATSADVPEDNPYLYLDLASGAKVEIDDVAALTSSDWDLAFERSSIRANGGDSGPGNVAVAKVGGAFEDVTAAPKDGEFATDDWVSDDCQYQSIPGGEPLTAIGEWYEYNLMTHELTPKEEVYVVRAHGGDLFKVTIGTWYGGEGVPATFEVAWAPL